MAKLEISRRPRYRSGIRRRAEVKSASGNEIRSLFLTFLITTVGGSIVTFYSQVQLARSSRESELAQKDVQATAEAAEAVEKLNTELYIQSDKSFGLSWDQIKAKKEGKNVTHYFIGKDEEPYDVKLTVSKPEWLSKAGIVQLRFGSGMRLEYEGMYNLFEYEEIGARLAASNPTEYNVAHFVDSYNIISSRSIIFSNNMADILTCKRNAADQFHWFTSVAVEVRKCEHMFQRYEPAGNHARNIPKSSR